MSEPQIREIREIRDVVYAENSVSVAKREYLSMTHVQSAALFARLAAKIENGFTERTEELFFEQRFNTLHAITVNES